MKKISIEKMEKIEGGSELAPCGQALFWGVWLGGVIAGGPGALIGAALVAAGPNCLDL
ncbi:MAG TPA: hypothetical protein VFU05_03825 [Cyclobacteriaceae bacterium]|nr:hypothetical protein [Cyclobacteriaceae bacterium]